MNPIIRLLLVLGVAIVGGFVVYAFTVNLVWTMSSNAATLWMALCFLLLGFLAHRVLPPADRPDLVTEEDVIVDFDDEEITTLHPDGLSECVRWEDLSRVEVVTTDEGPFLCDVFYVLHGTSTAVAIPQGATGERQLVERLLKLPGFDGDTFIQAMGSTSNKRFAVWRRG